MNYYLTSDEYQECLGKPILIKPQKVIKIIGIRNLLKVNLLQPFECNEILTDEINKILASNKIDTFYLINRHDGEEFISVKDIKCPIHVHVMLPKNTDKEPNSINDLCHAWWAVIYDNYEDARIHKFG